MEYDPPIETRTTEQLIEIVATKETWKPDVVELAKAELKKRGISLKVPEHRRRIGIKYKRKTDSIKGSAEYTDWEKLLIVLLGPISLLFFQDAFMFHGQGFKKKNRQGIIYLLLGLIFWGLLIYAYVEYIA